MAWSTGKVVERGGAVNSSRIFLTFVLSLALPALAFAAGDVDANAPIDPALYDHPIKVACVGDSITAGVGTSRQEVTSWAGDMGRMLGPKFIVGNFGSSGRTLLNHGDTPYQTRGAMKQALAFRPDVVVVMLGTNDSKPQNWVHKDEFAADYKNLIGKFRNLPTRPRVFVCHPTFVPGEGNFGINEKSVLEEIPIIDQVARGVKAGVIDVHGATADRGDLFPDHVHPNDEGALVIAATVCAALTGRPFEGKIPPPPPPTTQPRATPPHTRPSAAHRER